MDSKVLYMGHITEGSGWAQAAIDNILALDTCGVDVVVRNWPLNPPKGTLPPRITELMGKSSEGATHCIQHVLPHFLVGTSKYKKNIAYYVGETYNLQELSWTNNLALMDEVWVPNKYLAQALNTVKIKNAVVHHTCDISKYRREYPKISIPEIDHTFKFYTIADLTDRKNLESTITCFHAAFHNQENVSLIIKAKKFGRTPDQLREEIEQLCTQIKQRARIHDNLADYSTEVIITDDVSDQQICSLHQYGDCYVNTSFGEAWSIPTFEALAFGNKVIIPRGSGMDEYANNTGTFVCKTIPQVCRSSPSAQKDLFSGNHIWDAIDEVDVLQAMWELYVERNRKYKTADLRQFDYSTVGEHMKGLLEL